MLIANVTLGGKNSKLKRELFDFIPLHDNARKRRSWCHLVAV
jgi:hypothetical protein